MRLLPYLLAPLLAAAPPVERLTVPGLKRPVELRIDRWGVPHIYARSEADLFFAQGFNAARDRLWQIDLWRKRGLGLLAQDLGPAYADRDRAARLFLFRGDLAQEWEAYGPGAQATATAFVAGINAYVDLVLAGGRPLPLEFRLLGTRPARWAPEDVVRVRVHGLSGNLPQEVARAQTWCAGGAGAEAMRKRLDPPWTPGVPAGLDPCSVPSEVLRPYLLAKAEVAFPGAGAANQRGDLLQESLDLPRTASNTFAVAGSRSVTGRPILANDPHRDFLVPSLRYLAHLSAPGIDLIGAGEPAMPGVSLGHNGRIAVGLTVHSLDQEDLYIYETKPGDPGAYRYGSGWERFREVREAVPVRGQVPRAALLKFSRHGPVLFEDPANRRAYALRAAWLEPGMVPYLSSLRYFRARNWAQFLEAMKGHGLPGLNYLYADTAGNIGLAPSGRFPRRPTWDGLLPVPGDGRHEWAGFQTGEQLPRWLNPREGWLGSANEMNLPADYPFAERKPGFEWADRYRYGRLAESLSGGGKLSVQDLSDLQNDVLSLPARILVPLLPVPTPEARDLRSEALRRLKAWDGRVTAESVAACVFEVWLHKHLRPMVAAQVVPSAARSLVGEGDLRAVVELVAKPDGRLGPDPGATRDRLLLASLERALGELKGRLGPDPSAWAWGRLHRIHLVHPLSGWADSAWRARMDPPLLPVAGSHETVGRASFRSESFDLSAGASVRVVLDVGRWDASRAINLPGQSGDPESPHYQDLLAAWVRGETFPLVYTRKAVMAATERILRLEPPGTASR